MVNSNYVLTTKELSRKQVIVPMNDENKVKFIEALSSYITNLNCALKLDIMADFFVASQTAL